MTIPWVILATLVAVTVPMDLGVPSPSADSAAVRRLVQQWWTTLDPATYGSVHANDVVSVEPDGNVVRGRARLQEEFASDLVNFKGFRVDSVQTTTLRFLGADHALVQGAFRVVGPRPPVLRYVFLGVLARKGSTWQIVAASHTSVGD